VNANFNKGKNLHAMMAVFAPGGRFFGENFGILRGRISRMSTISPPSSSKLIYSDVAARWPSMSETQRQALKSSLRELAKGPWNKMTNEEKRIAHFITYGFEHRPDSNEWKKVAFGTTALIGVSILVFLGVRKYLRKLL
jgi:hypothetical protein